MEGGYFYTHLRRMRFLYKKRQDYFVALLEEYGKDVIKIEIMKMKRGVWGEKQ